MTVTDILSVAILLVYAGVGSAYDFRFRRIPDRLTIMVGLCAIGASIQGMIHWSWIGMLAGFVIALVAHAAGGDLKFSVVLGGLSGPLEISMALAFAFGCAIFIMWLYRYDYFPPWWQVNRWPLGPFIAAPVCAMVLMRLAE